jgi:ABC-type transport system involved in multi-copper enzyme maturation permease subunit
MRSLLLRSLLVAILVGPVVTFVSTVASVRTTVKYEPGLSEAEFKSYDNRTVSELETFMKSREVKFTRYQWLRESIGTAYFWKGIAWSSLGPCIGIFLGCMVVGTLERRNGLAQRPTTSG